MKKMQLEYGVYGVIIGVIVGALLGFLFLNQIKKTKRDQLIPLSVGIGALVLGTIGFTTGAGIGKTVFTEQRLGIDKLTQDNMMKDGRFWVGITVWKDKRNNKSHSLITARSNIKNLVTVLDDRPIIIHDCQSASQQTIPRYHYQAKGMVWKKLKEHYSENPKPLEEIFPTIT